ncbi:regulator of G-protein signaling 22-like [Clytia hemisphaerica]|uniref:RGS domain-containing protein n=1 Tax=Clytia hemisphaerica TaxID=252671 RepID=A0A7M5UXL9_9CNID
MEEVNLSANTIKECLNRDLILVQFFNSFLALTAFPKQLIYNLSTECFEVFQNTLADDVNEQGNVKEATTLKQKFDFFKTTIGERSAKIGYYVKVIDKEVGLEWIKENRFLLFTQSELYADYKLTKQLSKYQLKFAAQLLTDKLSESSIDNRDKEIIEELQTTVTRVQQEDYWTEQQEKHSKSFDHIPCEDCYIYQALSVSNLYHHQGIMKEELFEWLSENTDNGTPSVNLIYKQGVDEFKKFLIATTGEKYLLLWISLEKSKHFEKEEQAYLLQHIRERFLKPGSPHEFPKETFKGWQIDINTMDLEQLYDVQPKVLEPLLNYWCQRFTIHQFRQIMDFFKEELSPRERIALSTSSSHRSNLLIKPSQIPLRPLSCSSHIRLDKSSPNDELNQSEDELSLVERGLTRRKMRTKSAYPRLVTCKLPRTTNAGHKQLQMMSDTKHEGYGFKPQPVKYYHNDAVSIEEKKSVRLYIQPLPPSTTHASTVSCKSTMELGSKFDDIDESVEVEKDLESLVDMLIHEEQSGLYFLNYLKSHQNQAWINCYYFWKGVQEYNEYFFADAFQPSTVIRKANLVYAKYVGISNSGDLQFPDHIKDNIRKKIDPPYEDLFDEAEQHVLTILVAPWLNLILKERQQFQTLHIDEHMRYIEVNRSEHLASFVENDELEGEEEVEEDDEEDKISPEEVERPLPVSKDGLNFEALIRNKVELEHFQTFLETRHKQGIMDLTAWTDMEVFRRLPKSGNDKIKDERDKKAMEIREKWLSKNYFFGPNTPGSKTAIKKVLESSGSIRLLPKRPTSPVIHEAQKYSRARVERRWLLLFKETKEYIQRKKQRNSVTELVEDLLMKKKIQRSEHAWRLLNNRWNSSSREVAGLRMALSNEEECQQFRQFIKYRGELMDNNLNFWLEVQKYKDLCHSHVQESIIRNKIHTIIDVFIKSIVPPELQIDVPLEIAERLLEKAFGKTPQHGPYLFREAQTTIFRIMFNFWKDFLSFRSQANEHGNLQEALSELERQHTHDIKRKKLLTERRRLNRLVAEKRKKDLLSEKRNLQDILCTMAKTPATDTDNASVVDYDVTTFLFSKYQAEDELKMVESKLVENGIPLEEMGGKSVIFSHPFYGNKSTTSERTGDQAVTTGRRSSFFNTGGAMEMRRQSLGAAYASSQKNRGRKSIYDSDGRTIRTKISVDPSTYRFQPGKSRTPCDQLSVITDAQRSRLLSLHNSQMEQKKSRRRTLTKKSLKEFEKTPQGKPLKPLKMVTLPYVKNLETASPEFPILVPPLELDKPKEKPSAPVRRLPRNAGTANIVKKTSEGERES